MGKSEKLFLQKENAKKKKNNKINAHKNVSLHGTFESALQWAIKTAEKGKREKKKL